MPAETGQKDTNAEQIRQRLLAGTPLTERHERLAGVQTAIHEAGDGAMILLHGQGEFWAVWMGSSTISFGSHWDDLLDYALDRAQCPEVKAHMNQLLPRVGVPAIAADDLDRITTPTTLIHGRHDIQVPLKAAERASAQHGWPLHVIENARDDPAAEQPDAFLAALRSVIPRSSTHTSSQQGEDTR